MLVERSRYDDLAGMRLLARLYCLSSDVENGILEPKVVNNHRQSDLDEPKLPRSELAALQGATLAAPPIL